LILLAVQQLPQSVQQELLGRAEVQLEQQAAQAQQALLVPLGLLAGFVGDMMEVIQIRFQLLGILPTIQLVTL
jgi:hypothetical protein